MHPAALHKLPTQTVDSSQVFERRIVQKQPKIIKKTQKVGTETQLKIWNMFVPNKPSNFYIDFCRQRHF